MVIRKRKFILAFTCFVLFSSAGAIAHAEDFVSFDPVPQHPPSEEIFAVNIVIEAKKYLGTLYKFGGTTPTGFDCSGFVRWVYQQFDFSLPRTAREQAAIGEEISPGDLQVGDILVFKAGRTGYHTGIYVGDDRFIHSPGRGKRIREANMKIGIFANKLISVRRLILK